MKIAEREERLKGGEVGSGEDASTKDQSGGEGGAENEVGRESKD